MIKKNADLPQEVLGKLGSGFLRMAQCNPWFNSKAVHGIKLWNILSVRYYEKEIQACMFTLTETLALPSCFAIKFSICEKSYYFQNKNQIFPAIFGLIWFDFLGFFVYVCVCFGGFFLLMSPVIDPQVWWQATKWVSNMPGASEAPVPNCKLETLSWFLHGQKRSLMCNSTPHPSPAILRQLRWDSSSGRACAWLLACQTDIIKNSGGKKKDEREGICCFVPMLESWFGKKRVPGCTDIDIKTWCNEGIQTFSVYFR